MPNHEDWSGKTAGTSWMHRLLIASFRFIGVRPYYALVALFIAPVYMVVHHKAFLAIWHYFRRQHGFSKWRSLRYAYLNHYRFGQIIIDRFAAYAGYKFKFEMEGYDQFCELTRQPEGLMILSSHTGNYEIAGYTFTSTGKCYHALVFSGEAKTVMTNRSKLFAAHNIKMIPVSDDLSHLIEMSNALADGDIVSIPGDRIFGSPRYLLCDFLGGKARFPLGPFAMIVQRHVSAVAIFVMKHSLSQYKVCIRPLPTDSLEGKNREAQAMVLAQAYAKELEQILRMYPEQWFNYYEFWNDEREFSKDAESK